MWLLAAIGELTEGKKQSSPLRPVATCLLEAKAVNWLTDRRQSAVALSHCGAAANEPDNEKEGSDRNDDHCRDESVHVFKEVIVVVVSNEDVCSNVAQNTSGSLWVTGGEKKQHFI